MRGITGFLSEVADWARAEPGIVALALVGSRARGAAREDSDIDLLLMCEAPAAYLADRSWIERFGEPVRQGLEHWGKVTSVRVWYADGIEVEYGVAPWDWASDPEDEGDAKVVADGIIVLYEREGLLTRRIAALCASASRRGE